MRAGRPGRSARGLPGRMRHRSPAGSQRTAYFVPACAEELGVACASAGAVNVGGVEQPVRRSGSSRRSPGQYPDSPAARHVRTGRAAMAPEPGHPQGPESSPRRLRHNHAVLAPQVLVVAGAIDIALSSAVAAQVVALLPNSKGRQDSRRRPAFQVSVVQSSYSASSPSTSPIDITICQSPLRIASTASSNPTAVRSRLYPAARAFTAEQVVASFARTSALPRASARPSTLPHS